MVRRLRLDNAVLWLQSLVDFGRFYALHMRCHVALAKGFWWIDCMERQVAKVNNSLPSLCMNFCLEWNFFRAVFLSWLFFDITIVHQAQVLILISQLKFEVEHDSHMSSYPYAVPNSWNSLDESKLGSPKLLRLFNLTNLTKIAEFCLMSKSKEVLNFLGSSI